jgi:optic atrophy 3 protein
MRLRLGLLQDQAAIDRQLAKDAAEAHAKKAKSEIPTVKTEAQAKADIQNAAKEKEREVEKAKHPSPLPRIRPLSEAKAIDTGANFISETFLFAVTLSLIMFESWRSRRKETSRRNDVADRLKELEERDEARSKRIEEMEMLLKTVATKDQASRSTSWPRLWPTDSSSQSKSADNSTSRDRERKPTPLGTKDGEGPPSSIRAAPPSLGPRVETSSAPSAPPPP